MSEHLIVEQLLRFVDDVLFVEWNAEGLLDTHLQVSHGRITGHIQYQVLTVQQLDGDSHRVDRITTTHKLVLPNRQYWPRSLEVVRNRADRVLAGVHDAGTGNTTL